MVLLSSKPSIRLNKHAETPVLQYFNSNILHFTYTSFLQPHIVYEYDMDNRRKRKTKERTLAGYIKDHYHEKRIFAQAPDGSMIPISLVYKISLKSQADGNPFLLQVYGAYGTTLSIICTNAFARRLQSA